MIIRNILLTLMVIAPCTNAQDFYSLNYFPVWDIPSAQFNGLSDDLIGPNLYEPFSEEKIFNIHLEYTFTVERIQGIAATPFGSTFSGNVVLPIWFKVQDVNGVTDKFLKPDMIINPGTPSILPECGIVDASWVAHDYVGQTSLNTAIVTESDNMIMFATAETGDIIQSTINIDIQTPITVVEDAEGIYLFNDYYGNWDNNLNAGNWFAIKDLNGDIYPVDAFEGYKVDIEYVDISLSFPDEDNYLLNYLSLQDINDTTICESQTIEIDFLPGAFEEYNFFEWTLNGEFFSSDSTLVAQQEGQYTLSVFGCDTINESFTLSHFDVELGNIYDKYICPGDSTVIDFPSGNFSMYDDFSWLYQGQHFSDDSAIVINQEGTYHFQLYGCDTLSEEFELFYFESNEGDSLLSDLTICQGETAQVEFPSNVSAGYTSYNWYYDNQYYNGSNGVITISTAGVYTLELYGCDTIQDSFELNITGNNTSEYSFDDLLICEEDEISIDFPMGDFSSYDSFMWTLDGEDFSTDSTLVLEEEGVYGLAFYGCPNKFEEFVVEYKTGYMNPINDLVICVGETVEVDFPLGNHDQYIDYSWLLNGEYFSNDSSIAIYQSGVYSIELYGCDTINESFELSFYDITIDILSFSDTTICDGEELSISFPDGDFSSYFTFAWFYELINVDSTSMLLYDIDTLYTYQDSVISYTDSVLIDLDWIMTDSIWLMLDTIYIFDSLELTYWAYDTLYSNEFYTSDSTAFFNTEANYTLELYGCDTIYDDFFLTVNENNTEVFSFSDTLICEGDTLLIEFPEGDFSNYSNLTWIRNDEFYSNDSSIYINSPGEYSLHLDGCPYLTDYFYVNFYEYPLLMSDSELNVDSVIYICLEDDPVLITPFEDSLHTWYLDGFPLDTSYNERTLILEEIIDQINLNQVYTYDVDIDFECGIVPSNNTVEVAVIECECGLDMPNVFTPDGNDNNDYFKPFNNFEGEEVDPEKICMSTDFHMEIFNQWGENIISIDSDDEVPYWDGLNSNGTEMNTGVYYYRITYQVNIYTLPDKKEITGYFHLFR